MLRNGKLMTTSGTMKWKTMGEDVIALAVGDVSISFSEQRMLLHSISMRSLLCGG